MKQDFARDASGVGPRPSDNGIPINELMCQEIEKDVQFPSLETQEMQIKTTRHLGSFTKREK